MQFFSGGIFIFAVLSAVLYVIFNGFVLMNIATTSMFVSGFIMNLVAVYIGYKLIRNEVILMKSGRSSGISTLGLILLAVITWFLTGCSQVQPGSVGIKVNMAGDSKGVENMPLQTGWVFHIPFLTKVVHYPVSIQTVVWSKNPSEGNPLDESITFTTKDSLPVNADVSLSYQLKQDMVPQFYSTFRTTIDNFTHGFLHNVARDAFNEEGGLVTVETVMGDNGAFLKNVRKKVQDQVRPYGVEIQQFGFVGAPRPPKPVADAIEAKATAQQNALRVENEIKSSRAEAEKQVVVAEGEAKAKLARAEGESKANIAVKQSITPELLEWFKLQNHKAAIDKWDGKQPQVISGNSGLMLQVGETK